MASADRRSTSPPLSRRALLAGIGALAATRGYSAEPLTLSNARILTGSGTEIRGGVRFADGVITAIGPEITGGEDLGGRVLWPGMYNAGCDLGLVEVDQEGSHDNADKDAIAPQLRVVDAYNPRSIAIPVARCGAVVGALVMPGGRLVAGQAAWLRTAGDTVEEARIAAPAGVMFALGHGGLGGEGGPSSRLGAAAKIRDLLEANEPPEMKDDDDEDEGKGEGKDTRKRRRRDREDEEEEDEPDTESKRVLWALRRKEIKAIFAVERASDILVALELIAAYRLDGLLLGATEGHLVAAAIAESGVPVLLGPVNTQPSSFDTLHARYDNAARLHAAGVRFGLRDPGHHNIRNLNLEAGLAARAGLPSAVALAAITGNAPGFWGLKVGQIAPGFEATFVLSDDDPLQPRTAHRRLWMRGAELPMTSRQTELRERFRTLR